MADAPADRILLVDDDAQLLSSLALRLERRFKVLTALNGAEGLHVLETQPDIAVIISDMRMAGMDGAAFLARARQLAPEASRLILTGYADAAAAARAVNEGRVQRYLQKPCDPGELDAAIEEALEWHRTARLGKSVLMRELVARFDSEDPRSGLVSRRQLTAEIERSLAGPTRETGAALLLLHVQDLEQLCAVRGFDSADRVIDALARRLRSGSDEIHCIARLALEEIAVLTRPRAGSAAQLSARVQQQFAAALGPLQIGEDRVGPAIHAGYALLPTDTRDAKEALQFARMALQEAQGRSPGSICRYDPAWARGLAQRFELLASLRESIARDRLDLWYQPILDLRQGRIHACEALLRWNHPTLGAIPPAQIVALAEQSGEMPRLGAWVVQRALRDAPRLLGRHCERISINVSGKQLMEPGFGEQLRQWVAGSGLRPTQIELELTETVLVDGAEGMIALLRDLRARGFRIALDDFGTGYSALSYLQSLPVDTLKIDRSFVQDLNHRSEAILAMAMSLGRTLDMQVVVEGVETDTVLHWLLDHGARLFQGFLFARPMPLESLDDWHREWQRSLDETTAVRAVPR